jgi:hypothetical protein
MSSLTPFHAVVDALREPAVMARLDRLAAPYRGDLSRWVPEVGIDAGPQGSGPDLASSQARTRLLEALAQALALAAGPTLTVVFDDLQWADASSVELLAHMSRRRRQEPATMARVLATARTPELADNAVASAMLAELAAERSLARLPLGAFDDWSMLQLVQQLSGSEGGVRFAARLAAATGGNVFFALETIRALFESGELHADPGEGWSTRHDPTTTDYAEMPLPASVVEAVRARHGPTRRCDAARARDCGARRGRQHPRRDPGRDRPQRLGGARGDRARRRRPARRSIGQRLPLQPRPGAWRDPFGAFSRAAAPDPRQLAAALEPLKASPARIARHWEQAGQAEAAARAWVGAAEAAAALHAHRESIDHYGRAAALASDPAQAFEWHDLRFVRMMKSNFDTDCEALLPHMLALAEQVGSDGLMFRALAARGRKRSPCAEVSRLRETRAARPARVSTSRSPSPSGRVRHRRICGGHIGRAEDALARRLEQLEVAERSEPSRVAPGGGLGRVRRGRPRPAEQAMTLRERALRALMVIPETEAIMRAHALEYCSFVTSRSGRPRGEPGGRRPGVCRSHGACAMR